MKLNRNKMFLLLVQIVFTVALLELVSYFFLQYAANPLLRARRILAEDSRLGWRTESHLSTRFEGKPLLTDADGFRLSPKSPGSADKPLLLTLGPSSAFGWGVEAEETYSQLTASALGLNNFNVSQIGYSSIQGRRLYETLAKKNRNFAVAVVAYGVNDLDRFRFFGANHDADSDYFSRFSVADTEQMYFFPKSNLQRLIKSFWDELSLKISCQELTSIKPRADLNETIENMRVLVDELQSTSKQVVLINTPYFDLNPKVIVSDADLQNQYSQVEAAAREGRCGEALRLLTVAKNNEPYNLPGRINALNEALATFSKGRNITLIDAASALSDRSDNKVYFVDPVHPSPLGHQIISRLILSAVMK